MPQIFRGIPGRRGHFLLESGYHTDLWLSLETLFLEPAAIAPAVRTLADLLRPYAPTAIAGPLLGGAFLAQAVATLLGVRFYACVPAGADSTPGLFTASYALPPGLVANAAGERCAVVDDAISAGSSVRACVTALVSAGAMPVAIGTLLLLGAVATEHFATVGIPLVALETRPLTTWLPAECPQCRSGTPLENLT